MSSPSSTNFIRAAALGVLLVASTTGAQALTVTRCNQLVGGTYVPVLVIDNDGSVSVHQIGEDGLTRGILFDAEAALQWAVQRYGGADAEYIATCSISTGNGIAPQVVEPPPVVVGDDDDDDDYGGTGCEVT